MAKYADLHLLKEDERINPIGRILQPGQKASICTDDEPGKPERYIQKLNDRFPDIKILKTEKGPVDGIVTIFITR